MKLACPHCHVAYSIDDRRVPAAGLNVRCPKCRNTFPVRKEVAPEAAAAPGAIPLPAPAAPAARAPGAIAPPPPPEPPGASAPVPLPAPGVIAPPPPPEPEPAFAEPAAEAAPEFAEAPGPFDDGPVQFQDAGAPGALDAPPPEPSADPFAFSPADFDAPAAAAPAPADPLPVEAAPPRALVPPPPPDIPLPDLAAPPAPAGDPLGFGEVDLAGPPPLPEGFEPLPAPDAIPPAPPPAPAPAPAAGPQEELEMLFGADPAAAAPAKKAPSASGAAATYKVRRRSGKVFGPFQERQIVEMLGKGELMGNEDVSPDGGGSWNPIGAVPAFGDALRSVAAQPVDGGGGAGSAPAPHFGDRMAAGRVLDAGGKEGVLAADDGAPRWKKLVIPAAVLLVVLGVGVGAGFTKKGFFFVRAFRRGDQSRVAAQVAEARTSLQRADFAGDRAALDAAARALAADPESLDGAALQAHAAALLELRHGGPAGALDQARRNAARLEAEEKGSLQALAARLAVTLAAEGAESTAAQETALELAASKAAPDVDVLALLARSALARGDGARAATLFAKIEGMKPGTARAGFGTGLALVAKRDAAGARAAFEKVLKATPDHLPSRLELAALAEAGGDLAEAEAQLAPLLAGGAEQKLAPVERARALTVRALLLSRVAQKAAEADQVFEEAVKADGRRVDVRLAFAAHRLRRGDVAGAIAILEPVAPQAVGLPPLAALRIRALAAAGRALDASSLADQALAKSPGDSSLLLAKATALEASGKRAEAATLFGDAAARDPGAVEPRLALGRIALGAGDLARARVELNAAAEKGPRQPAPRALLGDLAVAEGDLAGAEKAYEAALALDPEFALAEVGLARLALARGDDAGARARLERALAVDPRSVEGQVQYGTLLWRANDLTGAEKALRAALEQRPTAAVALARLGAVLFLRGDTDGAVQRLTAAVGEDGNLPEARFWLGRALLKKGETPGAIAALQKAVSLDRKNPEYHVELGLALERSGALTDAIEAYRAGAAADPKHLEAYERLGALFAANGRYDDASAAYEKAVAAAPKISRNRIALAEARARLGKHEEAIKLFREVLKLEPAAVQVFYKLARSVHELEGAKAATPLYERAARDDKKNAMPHYFLGYLYKEKGQRARALGEFKRFLELKPDADEKKDIEAEIEDLGGGR